MFLLILITGEIKLSSKIKGLLSVWPKLCSVNYNLLENMKIESTKLKALEEMLKLINSVRSLYVGSDPVKVHVFGSRVYGMASQNSDVDLYLDIGKTACIMKYVNTRTYSYDKGSY